MTDSIFPRAIMRERGAAAFRAGKSRDDHAMNWHAPGLPEWHAGWDSAAANSYNAMRVAMRVELAKEGV